MTTVDRDRRIPEATAFAADAERITNNALLDEWLSLYHDDAVADWITDGASVHHEGIDAIRRAATVLAEIWRHKSLRVHKTVECADSKTIVLSWNGGFRGRDSQIGIEIWTFRDGRVAHHRMHTFLEVRPAT